MIEVNSRGSTAYRRQFTVSGSKTTISFASMFSAGNSAANNMAGFFSDSSNDGMLSRLYEQMTGQTIGSRSGVTTAKNENEAIVMRIPPRGQSEVDTSRPLNIHSKGDHKLTADEIEMLRAKYDMDNLTNQDKYDLLRDLTDLGVLTADEAESAGRVAVVETNGFSFSYTVIYIQDDDNEKDTLLEHLMRMLRKEREEFASAAGLIGKPGGDKYRVAAAKLEASITHHEKVCSVIEKLSPN